MVSGDMMRHVHMYVKCLCMVRGGVVWRGEWFMSVDLSIKSDYNP